MLLFGLILLMSATSLLGLTYDKKRMSDEQVAYRLSHNLMETLMALPLEEAKTIKPEKSKQWTANHRYEVRAEWEPYSENKVFEKVTLEYLRKGQVLIRLVALHPER